MRFCAEPRCGVMVPKGYCANHTKAQWTSQQPTTRIRGRKLQLLRAQLFDREPLCAECKRHNRVAIAVIRDHIIPLAEGGKDDRTNEQGLCQACSDKKTQAESLRGRDRGRG